jgi:hypothetical protein
VLSDDEVHAIFGLLNKEYVFRAYKQAMECFPA